VRAFNCAAGERNNKEINRFINSKVISRTIGALYYPESDFQANYIKQRLSSRYDAIVFFRETNASKPINTKK
jgi:erythromycin esterase-like protein